MREFLGVAVFAAGLRAAVPPAQLPYSQNALTAQDHLISDHYDVKGTWTVTGVAGSAEVTHLRKRQIKHLIGSLLVVGSNDEARVKPWMKFPAPVLPPVTYDTQSKEFWFDFRTNPSALKLPEYVTVSDFELGDLVSIGPNRALLDYEGIWFTVERQRANGSVTGR